MTTPENIPIEDRAAEILVHAFGALRWYAEDGRIGVHGTDGTRAAMALAATPFRGAEEPMLMVYVFGNRPDAERVVYFAGLCRIPAPVAKFALAKLVQPTRFAAGDFSECRPKGRRADIDFEIRRADQLFRRWLRVAAASFVVVHESSPPTSGEIQNPAKWHLPSEKMKSLWWPRFPAPVMPIEGLEPSRAASTTAKSTEPPTGFYPQPYPRTKP